MSERFAIFGNAGAGKSTLARELSTRHRVPVLDLDTVYWQPGKQAVPRAPGEATRHLRAFVERHDGWIVEGCYETLISDVLDLAPTLVFVDRDEAQCHAHCNARPWEAHKFPSKAAQDAALEALLAWVSDYYHRDGPMSRRAHAALFDTYTGRKRRIGAPGRVRPG